MPKPNAGRNLHWAKIVQYFKSAGRGVVYFGLILLITVPLAEYAYAGIISQLAGLLGLTSVKTALEGKALTSQTIPLLSSGSVNDPTKQAVGGGDTTIVGGTALLPDAGPLGTAADITEGNDNGQISLYVVRAGDSLSQIAQMFKVSVNTILWANDLSRNQPIHAGQVLLILPITGVRHTVVAGDTLDSLAKKFHGDKTDIIRYNGLEDGATLAIGQIVIIPNGEDITQVAVSTNTSRPIRGSGPNYVGYYQRPIAGGVRTQGLHGYNAVDLATYFSAPIYAVADGVVIVSRQGGWNGGYGNYLVIQHPNGTQTLYAHNTENYVVIGEAVQQGQVIGTIGVTGQATGAHVHFEVRGAANPF